MSFNPGPIFFFFLLFSLTESFTLNKCLAGLKEAVQRLGKYTYSHWCWKLDENNTTVMSVSEIWSYSQEIISRSNKVCFSDHILFV